MMMMLIAAPFDGIQKGSFYANTQTHTFIFALQTTYTNTREG